MDFFSETQRSLENEKLKTVWDDASLNEDDGFFSADATASPLGSAGKKKNDEEEDRSFQWGKLKEFSEEEAPKEEEGGQRPPTAPEDFGRS